MSVLCGNFLAMPIMKMVFTQNHTATTKGTIIPSIINYLKELDWSAKFESHDINHNYNLSYRLYYLHWIYTYIPKAN